jgi:hypothetical protein
MARVRDTGYLVGVALLAGVLLGACATGTPIGPLATPDRALIPPSGPYVVEGDLVAGPPLPGLRFAPSVGTCAPPPIAGMATACCDNAACNGHCVLRDDGRVGCSCYGQAGGCPRGTVCSKLRVACVPLDEAGKAPTR